MASAVAVLLKRGRGALLRGDVNAARGTLKAALTIDIRNVSTAGALDTVHPPYCRQTLTSLPACR